jgi:hypothetical protein
MHTRSFLGLTEHFKKSNKEYLGDGGTMDGADSGPEMSRMGGQQQAGDAKNAGQQQAGDARDRGQQQAGDARDRGQQRAGDARDRGPQQAGDAKYRGQQQTGYAKDRGYQQARMEANSRQDMPGMGAISLMHSASSKYGFHLYKNIRKVYICTFNYKTYFTLKKRCGLAHPADINLISYIYIRNSASFFRCTQLT